MRGELTHFQPMFYFYTPENIRKPRFSDVFRGYKSGTLVEKGLMMMYDNPEAVALRCYSKQVYLKISQYSQENNCWYDVIMMFILDFLLQQFFLPGSHYEKVCTANAAFSLAQNSLRTGRYFRVSPCNGIFLDMVSLVDEYRRLGGDNLMEITHYRYYGDKIFIH